MITISQLEVDHVIKLWAAIDLRSWKTNGNHSRCAQGIMFILMEIFSVKKNSSIMYLVWELSEVGTNKMHMSVATLESLPKRLDFACLTLVSHDESITTMWCGHCNNVWDTCYKLWYPSWWMDDTIIRNSGIGFTGMYFTYVIERNYRDMAILA